jgi:hypothetical protein
MVRDNEDLDEVNTCFDRSQKYKKPRPWTVFRIQIRDPRSGTVAFFDP